MTEEDGANDEGPGFLSRWSRKKREASREEEQAALPEAAPEPTEPSTPAEEESDPDAMTQEEIDALPPVESVADRAGLEPFFRKGVPPALRNAARRRMWMLNPTISTYLDVARDYAYDWNTPGGVPGSGGPIAPEAAARIAERLLARSDWRSKKREEQVAPAAEELAPELETGETAPGATSEHDPAETPAPVEPADESMNSPGEVGSTTAEAEPESKTFVGYRPDVGMTENSTDEAPARPRRHGGAMPR